MRPRYSAPRNVARISTPENIATRTSVVKDGMTDGDASAIGMPSRSYFEDDLRGGSMRRKAVSLHILDESAVSGSRFTDIICRGLAGERDVQPKNKKVCSFWTK